MAVSDYYNLDESERGAAGLYANDPLLARVPWKAVRQRSSDKVPTMRHQSSTRAMLGAILWLSSFAALADETEPALWVSQEIHLVYRSQLTLYECASVRRKVMSILHALGAHASTDVRLQSCNISQPAGGPPSQLVSMQIHVLSAAPATAQLRAALAKRQSRRELLERLGARTSPPEEFTAVWRRVDLTADRELRLGSSDCELLEQLTQQVLPKLSVKVLARERFCSQSPHRLRKPTLKVLALKPAPHADSVSALGRRQIKR